MWTIRPVELTDLPALYDLARALGPGMTTLPAEEATLACKVEISLKSFAGIIGDSDKQFLMVLDDGRGTLLGVSAVYAHIGRPFGFFSYHVDRLVNHSPQLGFALDCTVLTLSNAHTGLTEIGTLAVRPDVRKGGAGRLLARARYLLMACFPEMFADRVVAEMRGWLDADGNSPFWSAVGEKFFHMDFAHADVVSATKGPEFIANLVPKFPIYLDLLPKEVSACIGRPHDTSAIALAMLIEEGFRYESYIDVFDAGPQVIAQLDRIKTVANSRIATIVIGDPGSVASEAIIANNCLDAFRLVSVPALEVGDTVVISAESAGALLCETGDVVRLAASGNRKIR